LDIPNVQRQGGGGGEVATRKKDRGILQTLKKPWLNTQFISFPDGSDELEPDGGR